HRAHLDDLHRLPRAAGADSDGQSLVRLLENRRSDPRLMLTLLLAAHLVVAPECGDMPLRAGTVWTYRARVSWSAGGLAVRDTSFTWTTRIFATLRRDSSIVAAVENWPSALAWWAPSQPPDTSLLVCRNDRVFHLGKSTRGDRSATAEAASGALNLNADNLI